MNLLPTKFSTMDIFGPSVPSSDAATSGQSGLAFFTCLRSERFCSPTSSSFRRAPTPGPSCRQEGFHFIRLLRSRADLPERFLRRPSNCAQRWCSDCQRHAASRSARCRALTATEPPRKPAPASEGIGVVMHGAPRRTNRGAMDAAMKPRQWCRYCKPTTTDTCSSRPRDVLRHATTR
jgi:hypothetical protein